MIGMPCTVHECKTCQLDLVYIGQQSAVMTAEGRSILGTFGSMRIGWPSAFFLAQVPPQMWQPLLRVAYIINNVYGCR